MATWNKAHDNPGSAIEELIERLDKAEKDRDKMVEALRWYASNEAWTVDQVEGPDGDYGSRARRALEGLE